MSILMSTCVNGFPIDRHRLTRCTEMDFKVINLFIKYAC